MKIASTLFQALTCFSPHVDESATTACSGLSGIFNHEAEFFLTAASGTQQHSRSSTIGAFVASSYTNKKFHRNTALCLHMKEHEKCLPSYESLLDDGIDKNIISKNNPLHLVINGGGPAGLALAVAMKDCPQIHTTVLEKGPSLDKCATNSGQAYLWTKSTCLQVLKQVDCVFANKVEDTVFAHIKNSNYFSHDFSTGTSTNDDAVLVNRLLLLKTMENCLSDKNPVKYETEIVDFRELPDKKLHICTSRNETLTCDVLVGADGIWSSIKSQINGPTADKMEGIRQLPFEVIGTYLSSGDSTGRIQENQVKKRSLTLDIYQGKKGYMTSVRGLFAFYFRPLESKHISKKAVNKYLPFNHCSEESCNEFVADFEGNPKALELIKSAPDFFSKPLYDYPPSVDKLWSKGSVVLIGDAINAVSPVAGNGALEAMKDAIVLKQELDKIIHRDQIVDAFGNYKAQRINQRSAITIMGRLMLDAMATSIAPLVIVFLKNILDSSLFQVHSKDEIDRVLSGMFNYMTGRQEDAADYAEEEPPVKTVEELTKEAEDASDPNYNKFLEVLSDDEANNFAEKAYTIQK